MPTPTPGLQVTDPSQIRHRSVTDPSEINANPNPRVTGTVILTLTILITFVHTLTILVTLGPTLAILVTLGPTLTQAPNLKT